MNILKLFTQTTALNRRRAELQPVLACQTDRGLTRQENQDRFLCRAEPLLLGVADGMGGHQGGSVAAETCVTVVEEVLLEAYLEMGSWHWPPHWGPKPDPGSNSLLRYILGRALDHANQRILEAAEADVHLSGMGTTFTGGIFFRHSFHFLHVGDTRIYRLRAGQLEQLTIDQNYAQVMREQKHQPSEDELRIYGNRLTQAVGDLKMMSVYGVTPVAPDDLILLCSDGLHQLVSPIKLCAILSHEHLSPQEKAASCIAEANRRGGTDNITAVIAQF